MTQLHDLRLLVQQKSERIAESQPDELDLSVVQVGGAGPHPLLAGPAGRGPRGTGQRCRASQRCGAGDGLVRRCDASAGLDQRGVVSSIEIPLPAQAEPGDWDDPLDDPKHQGGPLAA